MPNTPRTEESIFAEALDKTSPEERVAFLDRACGDDFALRQRVDNLLHSHEQAGSFLGKLPVARCSTIDDQPLTEGPGTVIGHYKLLQRIGEGGFGAVYMAEQKEPVRRRVALKVIKLGMDTKEVIARFEAERQALALMDHPNIAKVLDAGATETGRPYFVMELVKGVSISEFSDKNQLAAHDRLELFLAVCQAVQHAHQKGVIHRDLKPSNILVTLHDGKPVPKVIDFGVAKALNQELTEKTLFTAFGHMIGTPQYMSPEQAEMSGLDMDTRSDIYSLGVLLYELLTGTTPLEAQRLRSAGYAEMQRIIREEEPPRPSLRISTLGEQLTIVARDRHCDPARLRQILRGELDWIVMKALEKDRTRRYETASGLARDIQRYLADEPVEACPPSAGYKLRKFARKYRKALATVAVFVAVLVVGTVISAGLALRATAAEREAAAQRDAAREAEHNADLQREEAQKKETTAQVEATKAKTLVGLLQELLGTANPDSAKGPHYTVRQMLDDFEVGLGDRLKGQPDVEADIRISIGLAYFSNTLYEKAEAQFRRALELRRSFFGSEHLKVAEAMTHLAWSLRNEHAWLLSEKAGAAAEKQAREAVLLYRKLGEKNEDLARALLVLGFKFGGQPVGSVPGMTMGEAEAALREALSVAERCAQGKLSPLVAEANRCLAVCLMFRGRAEDAKPLAARAVELHLQVHGNRHPETARGFLDLGYICLADLEIAEAEHAFRESLAIFRRVYGGDIHLWMANALRDLVYTLDVQYKDAEADAIVRECLAAWHKPDYSFHTGDLIPTMRGLACIGRGDYAEAEAYFRQAVEISRRQPGLFLNPSVFGHYFTLGGALFLQGKEEEARAAVQKMVPLARAAARQANTPPALLPACAGILVMGGSGAADDLQAALSFAQQGVDQLKEEPPESRALALIVLAAAYRRSGNRERATQLFREALELPRPRATLERRIAERELIQCLQEMGNVPAVEKVLRQVLSQRQTAWPKGHPEIAVAQANLGGLLADQKQPAEAEPLLLAAFESLKTHAQADSPSLKRRRAEIVERLAQLYDTWGKPDEAAKWRKELERI